MANTLLTDARIERLVRLFTISVPNRELEDARIALLELQEHRKAAGQVGNALALRKESTSACQLTLLPCPFCGAEAHFDLVWCMSEERVYAGACTECSCEIMNGPIRNSMGSGWYGTKEAAAADWNRRETAQGGAE